MRSRCPWCSHVDSAKFRLNPISKDNPKALQRDVHLITSIPTQGFVFVRYFPNSLSFELKFLSNTDEPYIFVSFHSRSGLEVIQKKSHYLKNELKHFIHRGDMNSNVEQFFEYFRQITLIADFGTLVAMSVTVATSLVISLIIYIRCKSRPGKPLLQLFSLFVFPILAFFIVAFFKLSPLVATCENDRVTVECVEADTISGVIDLYKARGEQERFEIAERVRTIHSTKSFMMALSKKYALIAILFALLYPISLLLYTRRHIKS